MDERLERLFGEIYNPIAELNVTAYITKEPLKYCDRKNGTKAELTEGDRWGELWDCAWMNMKCDIPDNSEGKLALLLDVGGEGCVFDKHGNPFKGITNKDSSYSFHLGKPGKTVVYPSEDMLEGGKLDIWVDCGANDLFGENADSPFELIGILHMARLAVTDEKKRSLYYDLEVIKHLADAANDESLKKSANECFEKAVGLYKSDIASAESLAKSFLLQKSGSDFEITALGHAHIDLAWLWPLRETRRKAARTFSTLMRNSAIYKNYLFGVSQPQLLEWVKEDHPALYKELKELYAQKRLELQGGFWVESDTNIPAGESLIRQMLYGKKYFRDEFGYDQEILWIPDVFGYSAQLPQIMAKSGIKYFLTIKMSWNAVNLFPYSTFNWVGLDGSSILTHMPPEGNYNSAARAESFINTEEKFRERGIDNKAMLLYGIGDGGGGPGMEHLERLEREYDLIGLPKAKQGFAIDFFKEIDKERDKYPEYAGELYLEKHQGTYTTQARNKRYNRKCEFALHDAEIMSTLAAFTNGYDYPKNRLEKLWKEVLLYQFHDIIPGSSIKRVYDETDARYEHILGETAAIEAAAFGAISADGKKSVFNPSAFGFEGFIENNGGYSFVSAPAMGFGRIERSPFESVRINESIIENELIRITFNEKGGIDSIVGKRDGFEYLCGEGNALTVYEDSENAWEVPDDFALNPRKRFEIKEFSVRTVNGVAERRSVYALNRGTLTQTVTVYPGSARIDFKTEVDWNETHKMLRTAFPLAAKSDFARCDIQYGSIERPTHRRDSFAKAKKEICAHKWVDICDGAHGAALLNDCKYGHRVWDSILDIDLLRSSMYPGIDADKGRQVFTYSFLPHKDNYVNLVVKEGYALNDPPRVLGKAVGDALDGESLIKLDCEGSVAVDWMKRSEDGSGIILRAFEFAGKDCSADISLNGIFGMNRTILCDNLENELSEIKGKIHFRPFDIITLKFLKNCE